MFKRLQTSMDWLIFLGLCGVTTPIGAFVYYFMLPKPGLKIEEELVFTCDNIHMEQTPTTIQLIDRYENGINIVVKLNDDMSSPINYGEKYTVKVTNKISDAVYAADLIHPKRNHEQ